MFNILYEFCLQLLGFLQPLLPKFGDLQRESFFFGSGFYSAFEIPLLISVLSAILAFETAYRTFRFAVFIVKLIRG